MKTVEKKGLQTMAKDIGLDLYSLPYTDVRPERQEWLASQPKNPPQVYSALLKCCHAHNRESCKNMCHAFAAILVILIHVAVMVL